MTQTPEKLFKYCSANAAMEILNRQSLRWSSPAAFNDPLELGPFTAVNFDRESLLQATIKLASSMIFSPSAPSGDTPMINAICRWREEDRFTDAEEAETVLRELLSKMVDQRMQTIARLHDSWKAYARKVRVCCFCSRPDNTVAWDRFADNHSGVCFRFDSGSHATAANPKPVNYSNSRPEIANLREQLDALLYNLPLSDTQDFEPLLLAKSLTRKPEQEWRSFRMATQPVTDENPGTWFEERPFDAAELSAVCFGIDTSDTDRKAITEIVKTRYSAARCYQANLANGKYDLEIQKA